MGATEPAPAVGATEPARDVGGTEPAGDVAGVMQPETPPEAFGVMQPDTPPEAFAAASSSFYPPTARGEARRVSSGGDALPAAADVHAK